MDGHGVSRGKRRSGACGVTHIALNGCVGPFPGYDDPTAGNFGAVVSIASQLAQSMASEDAQEDACQATHLVEAFQGQLSLDATQGDDTLSRKVGNGSGASL